MVMMMKTSYLLAALASLTAVPAIAEPASDAAPVAAAAAPAAPAIGRGALVFSADGRRIGRVDRVRDSGVSLIYNGKFIELPTASLTQGDRGLTTSLTRADLAKL